MTERLDDKIAIITGAGRGLGAETARELARKGAHVVLTDFNAELLGETTERLKSEGLSAEMSAFDVADHDAARRAVETVVKRHGRLDILVSNAGNQVRKPVTDYSYAEWRSVIDVHVLGAFNVIQPAVRAMKVQRSGRIITISSIVVRSSKGTLTPYVTAKGALASFTFALASELGEYNITANTIAPGYLSTEFTKALSEDVEFSAFVKGRVPLGRWARPEDIAPAIAFLSSDSGGFISGAYLQVDGGALARL